MSFISTIPLLSGPFTPQMVKIVLVQNYVTNHNQSIVYGIYSVYLLSTLYLVMYINLVLQEIFFRHFWTHTYAHK